MQKLIRFIIILSSLGWLLTEPVVAEPGLPFIGAVYDSANLDEVVSLAFSQDGRYLYTVGEAGSVLAVFSRDETTGLLSLVDRQRDGEGPVDGLSGSSSVALSPDGDHVYVAGQYDDAVAAFSRDETSGAVRFIEVEKNRRQTMFGLNGASSVTVSPNGRHVYAASLFDSAITAFSRNETTGALDFIETHKDGENGVDGLHASRWVTISPDGRHVYGAGPTDNAIAIFSRNKTTGKLVFKEVVKNGQNGVTGLGAVAAIVISSDGDYLYAAAQNEDTTVIFSRNETTGALSFITLEKDGQNGVDGLGGAKAIAISPDGQNLYVAGTVDNGLGVFNRDKDTGGVSFVEVHKDGQQGVDGLKTPGSIAISPDGRHLYVASMGDNGIAIFSRDETTGALEWEAIQRDDDQGVSGLRGAIATAVSPDGRHLYVAGFNDNAAAAFSRDETTGQLSFIEVEENGKDGVAGLNSATWVTVSPDGRYLYGAGFNSDAVAVFSRDETTGRLSFIEAVEDGQAGVDGLGGASSIVVSSDSRRLYVTGRNDDAVTVFGRNEATGRLSFIEVHKDGQNGVDGLDAATGMALSPDDRHFYVTGREDDTVVLFSREGATGKLSFVEVYRNGQNGVDGLGGANSVVVSPSGQHVYVAAVLGAVAVFSRDGATGRLSFVEVHKDRERGVDGLAGAVSLVLSPNSRYLYVTGSSDNAIALFWRFGDRGQLSFAGVEKDGLNGVDGLEQATGLAISPDGRHVYVAGAGDDAVAIFLGRSGGEPIDFYLPAVWKQ